MKISEKWLRKWVNPDIEIGEMAEQLTMAGLEVDAVEPVAGNFTGVVVGEIVSVEEHPNADKLRVCKVAGSPKGEVQVVCGASNAQPGAKVPFALVGAKLSDDFVIKKSKLRGVESCGMLCAQKELKAGDDDAGLWELPHDAPVGKDLRDYLELDDSVIEFDLTPNRSDCLSLKGLAREVAVLNKKTVNAPNINAVPATIGVDKNAMLEAPGACSRYVGRVIKNVDISRPSPLWLEEVLRRSGVRSIDPVVDITNYVLLELGQPMHAFDLSQLQGDIVVRYALPGESIRLLDGQNVSLTPQTLVIADNTGPIAMAGIMGGGSTAVSSQTRDIFLESAFFHPVAIAGRARSYGLHTDSSHRFERGVDFSGAQIAIERATALILEIVGGEPGPTVVTESSEHLPRQSEVRLSKARIVSGLGFAVDDTEVEDILARLGFKSLAKTEEDWLYQAPTYRFDVSIEEDLLEELARVYGYNRLPMAPVKLSSVLPRTTESKITLSALEKQMLGRGYQEVITYSFIDPGLQQLFEPALKPVELVNPISADMAVMRTSLIPGLVQTLLHNINRQKSRVRIFEKGLRFIPRKNGLEQTRTLAGLIYGPRSGPGWTEDEQDADFYEAKGDLEALLALSKRPVSFRKAQKVALHPGQTAEILIDGKIVGQIGAVHPKVVQNLGIPKTVFVYELSLDELLTAEATVFKPVSKFPEISRDLAIIVDQNLPWSELENAITNEAGEYLKNLKVFDVYSGEGIERV